MNTLSTITTAATRARSSLLVAAALSAASLGAVAQVVAPLSRADVGAELARARAAGDIERGMSESFGLVWMAEGAQPRAAAQPAPAPVAATEPKGLTRQQVTAELARARAAGELDHAAAEVGIYTAPAERRPSRYAISRRAGQPVEQGLAQRRSTADVPAAVSTGGLPFPSGDKGE